LRGGGDGGRLRPAAVALAGLACASMLLSGCGLVGQPLLVSSDAPPAMSVTSPVFVGNVIPKRFTCYGAGVSPPIFWSDPPPNTKSLVLVVDDSDAPISPRVYWLVFDISPNTTDLQVGALPPHARVAYNSARRADYDPPCPGDAPHNYRFTVYALNTSFGNSLPQHPQLLQALTTIAQHVIARGTLSAKAYP
jgi:Raf kinase inhibitor-like YbhB/YbcL family protein